MRIPVIGAVLAAGAFVPVSSVLAEQAAELSHRDRLYDVTAYNGALFVVGHPGRLMRSKDEGKTFEDLDGGQGDQALFSIDFNEKGQGAVVGRAGIVLVTEDGGDHWESGQVKIGEETPGLVGVQVLSDGTIVAVGEFGMIARSEDRGKTFERVPYSAAEATTEERKPGKREAPIDPACPPLDTSLSDNRDMIDEAALADVLFLDDHVGYIVGEFGLMLRTTDGGKSWSSVYACASGTLYNLASDGKDHLIAVGYNGFIVESEDGGTRWHLTPSGTDEGLYSVSLSDKGTLVTGSSGKVLLREPGGEFTNLESHVYTWLASSYLDKDGTGLVVGARGNMLRTDIGQHTFSPVVGE